MDLKAYEYLVRNESAARKFLLGFCWKNQQRFCPKCRSRTFIKLTDGRRRCKQCGYIYHDFSKRWINLSRLSSSQWLRVIKLFELEVSARTIAKQIGVAYNTAHRAVTILRMAILGHAEDAVSLLSGEKSLMNPISVASARESAAAELRERFQFSASSRAVTGFLSRWFPIARLKRFLTLP